MIDLRTMLYQKISPLCPRCFYEVAPQGTAYPYVVFSFPSNARAYKSQITHEAEVSIYDVAKSGYNVASEIDNLADEIIRVLDYRADAKGSTSAWFKFEQRIATPFPDGVEVWGRTLRFTARAYKE